MLDSEEIRISVQLWQLVPTGMSLNHIPRSGQSQGTSVAFRCSLSSQRTYPSRPSLKCKGCPPRREWGINRFLCDQSWVISLDPELSKTRKINMQMQQSNHSVQRRWWEAQGIQNSGCNLVTTVGIWAGTKEDTDLKLECCAVIKQLLHVLEALNRPQSLNPWDSHMCSGNGICRKKWVIRVRSWRKRDRKPLLQQILNNGGLYQDNL